MEKILEYANHLNASLEVLSWLNTTGKKALSLQKISTEELEQILDYLTSKTAPTRLQKVSIEVAVNKTQSWSLTNQKKGRLQKDTEDDITTVHDFLDGTKIVQLKTKKAYQREGFFMSHCVGGYDPNNNDCIIYSYRDTKNEPHATFEIRKTANEIIQIKGKGNGPIHPKYIHIILEFLRTIKITIRPADMKNLGYYHIDSFHLPYLNQMKAGNMITTINNEFYAR